jgi:hypothetical protein
MLSRALFADSSGRRSARKAGRQICENLVAIQFMKHFIPAARIEILSD